MFQDKISGLEVIAVELNVTKYKQCIYLEFPGN